MAQSTEETVAQDLEALERKKSEMSAKVASLDRERAEAKQMLDQIEEKKKRAIFAALDSFKKRYFHRLLGGKGVKVKAP
ncbi:MAG TPA: hypothetical protein VJ326_10510, partial [Thermoplasmata archaeon]|nr:hypothetical protein [Thermoplasmata archaeon]